MSEAEQLLRQIERPLDSDASNPNPQFKNSNYQMDVPRANVVYNGQASSYPKGGLLGKKLNSFKDGRHDAMKYPHRDPNSINQLRTSSSIMNQAFGAMS